MMTPHSNHHFPADGTTNEGRPRSRSPLRNTRVFGSSEIRILPDRRFVSLRQLAIEQAIRSGGFDDKMRPRLAIAAADRKQVRFTWRPNQPVAEFDARRSTQFSTRLMIFIDMKRPHGLVRQRRLQDGTLSTFDAYVQGYARVPMVPADVRPETGQLRDWHILWEVDEWADRPFLAEPPRDPLLLKHIRGSLYAVLAQWDLTELERAVMRETLVR